MFKKAFTLCMASLMAVSLWAADVAGRITLSSAAYNQYVLLIDGKAYSLNSNRTYLANLRLGRHTIEVYDRQRTARRHNRPVHAATFTLRPQYDMHIVIDRNGYVQFEETRLRSNRNSNNRYDHNDRNWDDEKDRNWNDRYELNEQDENWRGHDQRWESSRAMSDYDYNELVKRIRSQWTSSSKYNATQEAVTHYHFNTQQVRGLLELLSLESQRLNVAKAAYRNTVDAQNYSQLYHLFSRSAQLDLDRSIRSNRY